MARRALIHIPHIPFRLVIRMILFLVTLSMFIFVSWVLWRIYYKSQTSPVVVMNLRTELLQTQTIEELEKYHQEANVQLLPSSIFPTNDFANTNQ